MRENEEYGGSRGSIRDIGGMRSVREYGEFEEYGVV